VRRGPWVRPALMSASPWASCASMVRRCAGMYSSSSDGSLGTWVPAHAGSSAAVR
jgi:hypothetical protein